ncbi:MAG: PorP/SprF family type IX secretion system membrane protein, partial [Alloprevotella tannerae]|nr:PorP/SprF family type IX secretion system membrane protein [Alloprevotella tannerae]
MRNLLRYIRLVAAVLLVGLPFQALAQQDPAFAHYWELEPQFNPATAGRSDQLSLNMAYQTHATGYTNSGGTMYAGADIAFMLGPTRHGVGAIFQNDQIGLFSHQRFSVQYAYYFPLFGGVMSLGGEADMLQETLDGSKADLGETNDPAFPRTKLTGSSFDASAGVYYHHKRWYAGFGFLHLTSPVVRLGETNQYHVKPQYNFTAGYNIKFRNPLVVIVPSVLLRYSNADFRADLTGRIVYQREKKRLYAGASYAPQH